jgi:hypothetical protein
MPPIRIKYIGFDAGNPGFKTTDIVTRFFKEGDLVVENIHDTNVLIVGNFITSVEMQQIMGFTKCIVLYIAEPILKFQMCHFSGELYKRGHFHYLFGCVDNKGLTSVKFPIYCPCLTEKSDIFNKTNDYVKSCDLNNKKFATLISRHDKGSIREPIYKFLSKIGNISCPGPLFNNCSNEEVNRIGNPEYIKQFIFNICPENFGASHPGYITEKLMNACLGGAIPIYYGELDEMDRRVFNQNRIIFVDPNNMMAMFKTVQELVSDPTTFYRQDVFMPGAYEVITVEMHNNMMRMMDEIRARTR